jgi:hypothetical protein
VAQWFQIVYAPSIGTQNPMVLNVANNTAQGGENIILWPVQVGASNELWQYTQSGQFVSGVGDYWYNTFTSSKNPAQLMVLSQFNGVVSEPSQTGTLEGGADQFQLWKATPDCQTAQCGSGTAIQSPLNGNYLYASSGTQGQQVTLASTPQSQWVFWPPRTLQAILNQSNSTYPTLPAINLPPTTTSLQKSLRLSTATPALMKALLSPESGANTQIWTQRNRERWETI